MEYEMGTLGPAIYADNEDDDRLPAEAPSFPYPAAGDLVQIFFLSNLEAQHLLDEKISEWRAVAEESRKAIGKALTDIRETADQRSRRFCLEVLKISPAGKQLTKARRQIARLERLKQIANRTFNGESRGGSDGDSGERVARAREVSILEVISSVVETRKAGKRYLALCPFHADRNPSLVIYPERNRFRCYGCQKHGDAIEFVELYHGLSFRQAVKYLAHGGSDDGRGRAGQGIRRDRQGAGDRRSGTRSESSKAPGASAPVAG